MDESSAKNSPDGATPQPHADQSPASGSTASGAGQHQAAASKGPERTLPVVWSPRLDAGEDADDAAEAHAEAVDAPPAADEAIEEPTAATPSTRPSRFALLAASVAVAAAVGAVAGSLSATGIAHLASAPPVSRIARDVPSAQAMKAEIAELAALKVDIDNASRSVNGQFARLADRLDRVEHAQSDPAGKLAHIAEAVDRLEKHVAAASAAPEITGSIPTGSSAANASKQPDKILHDWIVDDVRGGRALVENRYGAVFAVTPGSVLPGVGHVQTIKRQDGDWIVLTERGIITSGE
jgi:hypothetical protein